MAHGSLSACGWICWTSGGLAGRPVLLFGSIFGPVGAKLGCRGGNRYVEGDHLTFGFLMLDDSLGYPSNFQKVEI